MTAPLSRRAMKRLRHAAAKAGAIVLPGDRETGLTVDQAARFAADDARFDAAIAKVDASLAESRRWIGGRS